MQVAKMIKTQQLFMCALCACLLFACASNSQITNAVEPPAESVSTPAHEPVLYAIGDIHGDYQRFVEVLQAAQIIDSKKRWTAGQATLVQLGDITDRGPDSRAAIDLLMKLQTQAKRQGGALHVLIGNHEMMNITGDLRYVHPGEYKAFKDSKSKARRTAYYRQTVDALREQSGQGRDFKLPKGHRKQWNEKFPLGFVAHRLAWAPSGDYGKWAIANSAVLKVNNVLFAHGGVSEKYADMSISEINTRARTEIADSQRWGKGSLIDDPESPFWFRGWATLAETPENHARLDRVLAAFGVSRMVIAHTPLVNTILPRFDGKVLMVDVGMSAHYGGANAVLELRGEDAQQAHAIVAGQRIELPKSSAGRIKYLESAAELVADASKINRYLEQLKAELESQPIQPQSEANEQAPQQAKQ